MDELKFPYTIEEVAKEEKELADLYWNCDLVRVIPGRYSTTRIISKYGPELYNLKPRPDDIWLIGYPRSGTTLLQEILYLLGTDLDYTTAASEIMDERFPYLEDVLMRPEEIEKLYQELCLNKKEPETPEEKACVPRHKKLVITKKKRFIKSHLGFAFLHPRLLEVGCKVVFIVRNIKDNLASLFYYPFDLEKKIKLGIHTYWKLTQNDLALMGNYMEMLKEAWKRRHNKNLLILFYEEVNEDKRSSIQKIANFLGKKLTEQELQTLLDHVDIRKFKENKSLNNDHLVDAGIYVKNDTSSFIRHGKSGGWRESFTKEMNEEVNEWFLRKIEEIPDFVIPECWEKAMDL